MLLLLVLCFDFQMLYYDKSMLVCLLFSCLRPVKMIEYVTICFANFGKLSDLLPIANFFWPIISSVLQGLRPNHFFTGLFTLYFLILTLHTSLCILELYIFYVVLFHMDLTLMQ